MSGINRLFTQSVTLETFLGTVADGPKYAPGSAVACFVQDSIKDVRDSSGDEVVSSATIFAPLTTAPNVPPAAGQFSPGSRVTVNGRKSYVITVARRDSAGPSRVHHLEVHLT